MSGTRHGLGSDLARVDAHVVQPEEYDEIPEVTEEMFARGELMRGGRPVRLGRPPKEARKMPTTIRLDPDVLAYFKGTGPGWQSRINETLRKMAGL